MMEQNVEQEVRRSESELLELDGTTDVINKLDVMTSKQFNRILVLNIMLSVCTFAHVVILASCCATVWHSKKTVEKGLQGERLTYATCNPPKPYMGALYGIDLLGRLLVILFSIFYVIRVLRSKRTRRNEQQIWTIVMMVTTAVSYSPALNIQYFNDVIIKPNFIFFDYEPFVLFISWTRMLNLMFSSIGQLFYIWACAHSYGFIDKVDKPGPWRFYFPKLLLLITYGAARVIMRRVLNISPSKLPLVTLATAIANFRAFKHWLPDVMIQVSALSFVEIVFFVCMVRRIWLTGNRLRQVGYLKHRSRQLGFRFFVMQNIISYALFIVADCCIILLIPRDFSLDHWFGVPYGHMFFNWRFGPVPRILNYLTTGITAYVNLPADSVGLKGWFVGSGTLKLTDHQPIKLQIRETAESSEAHELSNRMIFDVQIQLFNLAALAYLMVSKREQSKFIYEKFLFSNGLKVEFEIKEDENDTYVMVLSSSSRIYIVFKGTTSVENMKTDMKVLTAPIESVLPSIISEEKHKVISTHNWKHAKLHRGFADAYSSVSEQLMTRVRQMFGINRRPIYLCGHSLGGALSTICSLDIVLSLGVTELFITTFGSPKCGNLFWRNIFDELVPSYWRVAMRSDIITTLPYPGYVHVGKRAALTSTGELFLDPNAIETIIWSRAGLGVRDHVKPAYQEALKLFASKYLPDYNPIFINEEETFEDGSDSLENKLTAAERAVHTT